MAAWQRLGAQAGISCGVCKWEWPRLERVSSKTHSAYVCPGVSWRLQEVCLQTGIMPASCTVVARALQTSMA
jgi:hypothetical protein